jgi:hypothetical protein
MFEDEVNNPFDNFELSESAKRLANALYNTFVQEQSPYFEVSVKRLYQMFGADHYTHSKDEFERLVALFEELNEPIALTNFKYGSKTYEWIFLQFCEIENDWKIDDEMLDIHINEMYLAAMKEFMNDPFLPLGSKE